MYGYTVIRTNRKTLNITIERDKRIIVRAPLNLPDERISAIVASRKEWIEAKLNTTPKYPDIPCQKEFVSGESMMYLGINYQLVVSSEPFYNIRFDREFTISAYQRHLAHGLFKNWYMKRANEFIIPLARYYARQLGVQFAVCKISDMKFRWGSLTRNKNLNFNWRIIKAPEFVVRYIVIHELVHLTEPTHSPRFWHVVSILMPRYELAKDWLRTNGNILETDF